MSVVSRWIVNLFGSLKSIGKGVDYYILDNPIYTNTNNPEQYLIFKRYSNGENIGFCSLSNLGNFQKVPYRKSENYIGLTEDFKLATDKNNSYLKSDLTKVSLSYLEGIK